MPELNPLAQIRVTRWVVGAYLFGALLHLGQLPLWVILVAAGGGLWRWRPPRDARACRAGFSRCHSPCCSPARCWPCSIRSTD